MTPPSAAARTAPGRLRVLVLSDTHLGPRRPSRRLPDEVYALLERADAVLHAGDVTAPDVLHELSGFAPVHAVLGNNDVDLRLPERRLDVLGGVRVALVHDSGARGGRERRLRSWFPDADLVVFGHSHLPWHEVDADGQVSFNPGSPTERRMAPTRTAGWLEIEGGRIASLAHIDLGP